MGETAAAHPATKPLDDALISSTVCGFWKNSALTNALILPPIGGSIAKRVHSGVRETRNIIVAIIASIGGNCSTRVLDIVRPKSCGLQRVAQPSVHPASDQA